MIKKLQRQRGFTTIFFTIIVMILISIVVFSMVFLSFYEFQSILNYSHYQRAYFLALSAQEEALSLLSSNWNSVYNTSWIKLDTGEYKYEVIVLSPTSKKIIAQGKSSNITRKFECVLVTNSSKVDLNKLINYSIYNNGNLIIEDLHNIKLKDSIYPGTIGVTKNLQINYLTNGNLDMDVKGNIDIRNGDKNNYFKNYNQVDTDLMYCLVDDVSDYTDWLRNEYKDIVYTIDGKKQDINLDFRLNPTQEGVWDVLIISNVQNLIVENLNFEGLIIIDNVDKVLFRESTTIKGMILIFGHNTENINIKASITGNISIISHSHVSYFNGVLTYDKEVLERLRQFLSKDLVNNIPSSYLDMIKWNEVE
ncbi:hypothetical protein GC105_04905 [Alkalibaculum sp. M08DMB]|uniref:Type 4 fimbrial biogenesis protein PilX N-terminal domain-containing protein n=1 Tax=Alkalibaculum sporogenes TaxID=2655001 RepID=A0A6A7K7F5_9FIRM|nr:hypothetical protein [Alkalibaculum sporogenes]MPW25127.1 hypothetical protein [Alkalibaculum sporogenes]